MVLKGLAPGRIVAVGSAAVCVLLIVLATIALIGGIGRATLALPFGPPGAAMHVALDPLGASFLLLLSVTALPCALCEQMTPLPIVGMALIVLAADSFTLTCGLLLFGAATSWRAVTFAAVAMIVALAPLGDFAAIRRLPPEGWESVVVLALVIAAALAMLTVPLWRQRESAPVHVSLIALSAYLLIRVLFDLIGQALPLWWGVPPLLLGACVMVAALLCAALADTLSAVLSSISLHQLGMAIIALGVGLVARAVDLPSVAALALEAAWLSVVCYALCAVLLTLTANAVAIAAGTTRLDRLGGLIHPMPMIAIACLLGLFGVAMLPPGFGFAAFWLSFQSVLAAARGSGFGLQVLITLIAGLMGLSLGLASLAAIRVFGVVFLSRPRTPRAAVAEDAPRLLRASMLALGALVSLLGVLPALALLPARGWTNAAVPGLALRTSAETPGYSSVAIAALLAIIAIGAFSALRNRRSRDLRREPAWTGGFAKPPPWLPFGDPTTQYGARSFVEPLHRVAQSVRRELRARFARWRALVR